MKVAEKELLIEYYKGKFINNIKDKGWEIAMNSKNNIIISKGRNGNDTGPEDLPKFIIDNIIY